MRNRPYHERTTVPADVDPVLDARPRARLVVLFVLMALPVGGVLGRLVHIQALGSDRYTHIWERVTESYKPIPSRDGRILTADGVVVAYDEPQFNLAVHYGWITDPPSAEWVMEQARSRLTAAERRDPARLAAARDAVLTERAAMWRALSEAAGIGAEELWERRARIQQRVERVYNYVRNLRAQRRDAGASEPAATTERSRWWEQGWETIVRELTTPPRRDVIDPLVIREQLDYHVILENVPPDVAASVQTLPSRFPGVRVELTTRRVYPAEDFAAHIVGSRTPLTGEEYRARRERYPEGDPLRYAEGDRIGRSGIERAFDVRLRGRPGLRRIVRNRRGVIINDEVVREPVHGRDVQLSFDSRIQQRAESLLDAAVAPPPGHDDQPGTTAAPRGGCLIALDVRSGRVLAAAAAPRHNLQLLTESDAQQWQAQIDDARRPFFPRITQMTIPPGSVFKTVTAVALLESGVVDPESLFFCRGYLHQPDRDRCYIYRHYGHGHGDVDLDAALCESCNVYFFAAAEQIGPHAIADWAARFGFGRDTGADLDGERGGSVPDPAAESPDQPWYPGTTRQLAIGQASLTVTPLQVARMMAAIANDGYLVQPRFVSARPPDEGTDAASSAVQLAGFEAPVSDSSGAAPIPGLSAGTLERVRHGLRLVVEHPRGTGRRARLDEISIAGKTGTAEVGGGRTDHAWFAGFAPADDPRVAFVVVLEHGGSGGRDAAPLAREFLEAMLEFGAL